MKRKTLALLLLSLLIGLVAQLTPVQATYHYSFSYAPNNRQWFDSVYEEEVTNYTVQWIAWQFATYGRLLYYSSYYIDAQPVDYIYPIGIAEHNSNIDHIALFTKGHTYQGPPYVHQKPHWAHMCHTTGNYVWDLQIAALATGKTKLAVVWHCGTAQSYIQWSSMICDTCGKYYSWPMAYTKYNGMSEDGYNNPSTWAPYAFIGFWGYSEQFLSNNGLDYPWYYYHFVAYFYQMLVQIQFPINDAIDQACFESSGDWWPLHWLSQYKAGWDPDGPNGGPNGNLPPWDTQGKILGNGDAHYPGYPW